MKKLLCLFVVFFVTLSISGCSSTSYIGIGRYNYGYLEVLDATGSYTDMIGQREDTAMIYQDYYLSFYDVDHFDEPLMSFKTELDQNTLTFTKGKLSSLSITSGSMEVQSDRATKVPGGYWVSGTVGNDEGSITVEGFFFDINDRVAIETLQSGKSGNIKRSWEELKPDYFDVFEGYYTGYYNSITPRFYFPAMKGPFASDTFHLMDISEVPLDDQYLLIVYDMGDEVEQVHFSRDYLTRSIRFYQMDANGDQHTIYQEMYLSEIDSYVLQLSFREGTESYIAMSDPHGNNYNFAIVKDNNGNIVLEERGY